MTTLTKEEILKLNVSQEAYDNISLNRKSTFVNLFDSQEEFLVSVNTLDMKGGSDILFLAEVLRAAEVNNLAPINSLATYRGIQFRLAAVQTTELQTGLKINVAKREDFKKSSQPQPQPQPIQQAVF